MKIIKYHCNLNMPTLLLPHIAAELPQTSAGFSLDWAAKQHEECLIKKEKKKGFALCKLFPWAFSGFLSDCEGRVG